MRGKVNLLPLHTVSIGITPAYAGKSFNARFTKNDPEDHPRLCGEKQAVIVRERFTRGSPPPMRGKVIDTQRKKWCVRITPAYAGKRA